MGWTWIFEEGPAGKVVVAALDEPAALAASDVSRWAQAAAGTITSTGMTTKLRHQGRRRRPSPPVRTIPASLQVRADRWRKLDQLEPAAYALATEPNIVTPKKGELTNLLAEWSRGSQPALDRLMPHLYDELRALARSYLRRERSHNAVQTGTLVHEALMRLIDGQQVAWEGRGHFFGIAARLMRQILVDHARMRDATKRGAGQRHEALTSALSVAVQAMDVDVLALDRALADLAVVDSEQARMVELRFFGGLSIEETAEALGVSTGTVKREWAVARAWLRRALDGGPRS